MPATKGKQVKKAKNKAPAKKAPRAKPAKTKPVKTQKAKPAKTKPPVKKTRKVKPAKTKPPAKKTLKAKPGRKTLLKGNTPAKKPQKAKQGNSEPPKKKRKTLAVVERCQMTAPPVTVVPIAIPVPVPDARTGPGINNNGVNAASHSSHRPTDDSAASGDNVTINVSGGSSYYGSIIRNSSMQSCTMNERPVEESNRQ